MAIAVEEAQKGIGLTSPNPAVGAVIVKDGVMLGKGYHKKAGLPHAEREAIAAVKDAHGAGAMQGATIYVTLEPCSTTGRTPPCTQGIIDHGISEVVYGAVDPNPDHAGAADAVLAEAGVKVVSGVLEEECEHVLRGFSSRLMRKRPWVIAKTAMSLDGRITRPPGEGQWLTCPASREVVQELRASVDAIIVGGRTLRKDNPRLTVRSEQLDERFADKEQPYRVVITHSERTELPQDLNVFTDEHKERTIVYTDTPFSEMLEDLAERGCNMVMLECGGGLMGQWFDEGLVDECCFFYAPMLTGGPDLAVGGEGVDSNEARIRLKNVTYQKVENDVIARGVVIR